MLQGKHITFSYPEPAKGKTDVLADVSFEIREHDFIGLIGASGSGKTTLIKHLNGLLKAESGEILFKGENIYSKKYPVSELRKKVGLVFQYPEQQLFGRTILKDVMYGPLNLGMSEEEAGKSAKESLELVGISEEYYQMSPMELSGGQKRCVAIAGVLAMKPNILILDEPTAGLDPKERAYFRNIISEMSKDKIIIISAHIVSDIEYISDQVLVMKKGCFILQGTPEELLDKVNGEVWSCKIPNKEWTKFETQYCIANSHALANHVEARIISTEAPIDDAINVEPTLEDLYLKYFSDEMEAGENS